MSTTSGPAEAIPSSPLGVPVFRSVWLASMASNFGGLIQSVGAAWLMTSISNSPQEVALVQASVALPIMLFSLLAGAMADNFDRRIVMLCAQVGMLLVSLTLAAFAWLELLTPWLLLGFTFLVGCGAAFNNPAWQASVGDMVPRSLLPGAVALNSMGFNIARSVGPAIGGAIVAAAGAAAAFLTNALSYVALLVVLGRWRPAYPPRLLPRERIGMAMAAGLRYISMSPRIKLLYLRAVVFGFAASSVPALMPLVARDLVTGGPLTFGVLLGAFGIGAVAAALNSGRARQKLTSEQIVRVAAAALTVGSLITAASTTLWLTVPALLLAGAGWVLALTNFNVTIQLSAPRWVVARALSVYQMSVFGGMAFGSWTFGYIADHQGVAIALFSAAGAQAVGLLLGFVLPLPVAENVNLDPLGRWQEPDTAVPIQPRSGPVVITIEYRIAAENLTEFLNVVSERRRIWLRDGARRWILLRDLAEPEIWIERFHLPTWQDYVRTSHRRTHADAAVGERLRALTIDDEPPKVRRMLERQPGALTELEPAAQRELGDPLTDPTRAS